tara:strand:+ start:842 stop:1402 length:561 start_codon:yes stop_codon:yes gene_type:complete
MKKAVLTESFIVTDQIAETLKKSLDKKLMIKEIKRAHKAKERVSNENFYHDYFYTKLLFLKYYKWVGEYAQDHFNVIAKDKIMFANYSAIVLKPGESLGFHNHIDDWDYHNNSYDVSMIYPLHVKQGKEKTDILFKYDNGRFKKQRFKIPLHENFLVMFSSHLEHSILPNNTKEDMIFLSIKFIYE